MSASIVTATGCIAIKKTITLLLPILAAVESANNSAAIGDGGKAAGHLQIHTCVIADVNRIYGTDYQVEDRHDSEKSDAVAMLYLAYYGRRFEKTTGQAATAEIYARIWNGGPEGANAKFKKKYAATTRYWDKVKRRWGGD
jgi:hypothetical protein